MFANPSRDGIALRDGSTPCSARTWDCAGSWPSGSPASASEYGDEGVRVPDLDLRGALVSSVYGLLRVAMLSFTPDKIEVPDGYGDRLDVVTAELADGRPGWAGVRAMPIRPDGHLAWVLRDGAPAEADAPPLAAWLGGPPA